LHIWTIELPLSIRRYGSPSSFTADTFESFHIPAVKIPYRTCINKAGNINKQLANCNRESLLLARYRFKPPDLLQSSRTKLQGPKGQFTLPLSVAQKQYLIKLNDDENWIIAVNNLSSIHSQIEDGKSIVLFNTLCLPNGELVRASPCFHGSPYFNDVIVRVDADDQYADGDKEEVRYGYARAVMLLRLNGEDYAMLRWYRFCNRQPSRRYLLHCPYVKFHLPEVITLERVESIEDSQHLIQDFSNKGCWFVRTVYL
jgi:hypothetical protein